MTDQSGGSRGHLDIDAELWRANVAGQLLDNLTPYGLTGEVTQNVHNAVKGGLSLTTLALGEELEPYADCLVPIVSVTDANGQTTRARQGLYPFLPPKQMHQSTHSEATVQAHDVAWLLANDGYDQPYNVAAAVDPIATVRGIIESLGLRHNIPDTDQLTPHALTYPTSFSKLEICNALLNAAGYYTLWADRFGVLRSRPYFTLATAQPALQLYSGEGSPVINAIEEEGTYEGLANRVVIYKEGAGEEPDISVTLTNNDPLSPISTVRTGRVITRWEQNADITSVEAAEALARRLLEESASYTKKLKVTTLPLLERELHEVFELAIYNDQNEAVGFGLWWCDGYTLRFNPAIAQAEMVFDLKRLEAFGGTA